MSLSCLTSFVVLSWRRGAARLSFLCGTSHLDEADGHDVQQFSLLHLRCLIHREQTFSSISPRARKPISYELNYRLSVQDIVLGRAGSLRLTGKFIEHRLVARDHNRTIILGLIS